MKTFKRLGTRTLSVFLAILMIVSTISLPVSAIDIGNTNQVSNDEHSTGIVKSVFEVEELRDENVKHFRLDDGSYIAAQYDKAVHYLDENGEWQDIDNTLAESNSDITTNNARIKFAKKITGNETIFTLHENNHKITMSLNGAIKKTTGIIINNSSEGDGSELQKMLNLNKLSAKVIYENILDGVDLEYVIESYDIKENIIVKKKSDSYTYSFTMKLNNLTAILDEKGQIIISDDSNGEVEYIIPAPTAWDANGVYADYSLLNYTLISGGNGSYTLSVNVDSSWMNSDERAFPVIVDPPVSVPSSSVIDLDINSYSPDIPCSTSLTMFVSEDIKAYWKTTVLPYIPSSAYITNANISLSGFTDNSKNYVGVYQVITDWDETLTWNKTISSSPQGQLSTTLLDFNCINDYNSDTLTYSWNITELVREWYSGESPNYGIGFQIVSNTESSGTSCFDATDWYDDDTNCPKFTISYKDMKGIEGYWTFATQSAGFAGTGYVNYATGNLTFGKSLLSTTDSLMSYSPSFVYNSALANSEFEYPNAEISYWGTCMPLGFKLSITETIIKRCYTATPTDDEQLYMYILSDEDGTEHYFLPIEEDGVMSSTKYQDDDGLQLILDASSTTLTITDNDKNVRYYTKISGTPDDDILGGWYLSSISDAIGNKVIFGFEAGPRPISVSVKPNGSDSIDFLTIAYNSGSTPYIIWNETSREAMIFRYSSTYNGSVSASSANYLRKIEYAHSEVDLELSDWTAFYNDPSSNSDIVVDATAEYSYNSDGKLTSAKDTLSGYEIKYTYTRSGKVFYVQEYAGTTEGQKMSFSYYNGYTTVRSSGSDDIYGNTDDIITRYTFDSEGRVKSMYSTDSSGTKIYGASSGVYESQDNVKNNLKTTVVVGGSTSNYLLNGGFESSTPDSADYWVKSSDNIIYEPVINDGSNHYLAEFEISDYIKDSISQYTYLKTGTYTLSATIDLFNCKNVKLYMKAESLDNPLCTHIEEVPINEYYASGEELFASMTFTVGNYFLLGGENYKISFCVESGDVLDNVEIAISIDNVMLEENIGSSDYTMIQYGNFENFSINSSKNRINNIDHFWSDQDGNCSTMTSSEPFGTTGSISGDITKEKYLKQNVYTIPDHYLTLFDNPGESSSLIDITSKTYIISGFAQSMSAIYGGNNSHFALRVDVTYYLGNGQDDLVETHRFEFEPDCTDWQFVSGSIDTQDGKLVRKIDVYCEYSHQPGGYVYFDEIAFFECNDDSVVKYSYYDNGLLEVKKSGYYTEVYEYNEDKQLTRIANNNGDLIDYVYDDNGVTVDHEIVYKFKDLSEATFYPYEYSNPDAYITKTAVTKTEYEYNQYGQLLQSTTFEVIEYQGAIIEKSGTEKVLSCYEYETTAGSHVFGALTLESDNREIFTLYFYDETNGRLLAVVNADEGTGTCYTYDAIGNVTSVLPSTYSYSSSTYSPVINSNEVNYTYNAANLLESINTNSTEYRFYYDGFGNTDKVTIGGNEIVSYEYNSYNGKLHTINYKNGFSVNYVYDELDRIEEVWYNDNGVETKAFEYHYTAYGQMSNFVNLLDGTGIYYKYDDSNRLISYVEYNTDDMVNEFSSSIFYDEKSRPFSVSYAMDYYAGESALQSWIWYYYNYNEFDGTLKEYSVTTNTTGGSIKYSYDGFKRVNQKTYNFYLSNNSSIGYTNTLNYTFVNSEWFDEQTSSLVHTVTSKVGNYAAVTYTYEYDYNGNVTKITLSNGVEYRYVYDDLGQLIREDNAATNKTYVYTYDDAGNILTKSIYALTAEGVNPTSAQSTYSYGYDDESWGDKLTSYRGVSFTYDEIGNPLTYYNGKHYSLTWENGRQLSSIQLRGTIYFEYNDEGIRTSKTSYDVEHKYHLNGSLIMSEEWGDNLVLYLYDADGSPIGMQYRKTSYAEGVFDTYWFEKNLQGDIVAVYSQSGSKLITYTYDAWGNCTENYFNNGQYTNATKNPFRYRGYYLDTETGFYYLNSRYYDPAIGRFITADKFSTIKATPLDLTDKNLYAYCDNNPVTRRDDGGAFWGTFFDVVSLVSSIVDVIQDPKDPLNWIGLAGDIIDLAPVVSGVGEISKAVSKGLDIVDNGHDAKKAKDICESACFIAGTIVITAEGYVPIEEIETGDWVWATNPDTGETDLKQVVRTFVNETNELIHVTIGGETIITTPTHPFYVPQKGWTDAVNLRAGDILVMLNGEYIVIEKVQHEILETPITVYNFEVEDFHTYYVGEYDILVHNKCFRGNLQDLTKKTDEAIEGMDAHHVFPQKFREEFKKIALGNDWIDNPYYGAWWELHDHRRNARAYNKAWEKFLKTNPSFDEVLDYGIELSQKYGFEIHFN